MSTARKNVLLIAISLSLASLQLSSVWYELVDASAADRYFLPPLPREVFAAALVSLLLATSLFYVLASFFGARRFSMLHRAVAPLLVLSLFNAITYNGFFLFDRGSTSRMYAAWSTHPSLVLAVGLSGLAALLYTAFAHRATLRALRWVLLALLPLAAFRVVATVHAALTPPASCTARAAGVTPPKNLRRVVLLVFDELDQRMTFEARPSGVRLSELDALKKTGFYAPRVLQAGPNTLEAIPGMTSGRTVLEAEPASRGSLLVRFEDGMDLERWEESDTLFHLADRRGARTGIVGFYHDYCRLFPSLIRSCRQLSLGTVLVEPESRFASLVRAQLASIEPLFRRRNAIEAYRRSLAYARAAATDPRLDLVYLHVPLPHEPFLYDRGSRGLTATRFALDGYFGNLVLVDDFVGEIRRAMENAGLWQETFLVLTADHAWRASTYYDGVRDERVVFLLKPAQQHRQRIYDASVRATFIRDLVLALLDGELDQTEAVSAWLDARRS